MRLQHPGATGTQALAQVSTLPTHMAQPDYLTAGHSFINNEIKRKTQEKPKLEHKRPLLTIQETILSNDIFSAHFP